MYEDTNQDEWITTEYNLRTKLHEATQRIIDLAYIGAVQSRQINQLTRQLESLSKDYKDIADDPKLFLLKDDKRKIEFADKILGELNLKSMEQYDKFEARGMLGLTIFDRSFEMV